ncbi:MAG: NAD(P)-binding domain-containing protein [Prochloron sp. SP5CPC1]|nr:NAD(P)-binding domain-containing protein [Candidatus Paraprochloron terpiosi SP5CPC1]
MIKQQHFQYLVLGAGPAGIQMGYYLENSGRDYLILEGGKSPGSFYGKFPRHRKLISINKIHTGYSNPEINLRHDWNSLLSDDYGKLLKSYSKEYFPSADDFLSYLKDFVRHYQIKIKSNTKINKIEKANGVFWLQDCQGNIYCCQYLIIATGVAKPYIPNIPGIESTENYVNVSVNAKDFANQRVLIKRAGDPTLSKTRYESVLRGGDG